MADPDGDGRPDSLENNNTSFNQGDFLDAVKSGVFFARPWRWPTTITTAMSDCYAKPAKPVRI